MRDCARCPAPDIGRSFAMNASVSSKPRVRKPAPAAQRHSAERSRRRMRDVPNVQVDDEFAPGPDVSAIDVLGAELCHRIVRDLADGGLAEGADAYWNDPSDWLQAEADGAHLLQKNGR
jgi:hypothetical protein